jgi:3-hydroxy-3-methylglutaryl CoA synthase/uncharacterized OB-fold protein
VATYDEDTTTMAVAAARAALAHVDPVSTTGTAAPAPWFATTYPTYAEKSNAAVIHAALRLPRGVQALDLGSSNRAGLAGLAAACASSGSVLMSGSDLRFGLPGSADEAQGGDGAACFLVGDAGSEAGDGSLIAEFCGSASLTEELVDRWRVPGEVRTRQWEERFGETRYAAMAFEILNELQQNLGISRGEIAHLVFTGQSPRAVATATRKVGASADSVTAAIGNTGCAQPLLALAAALELAAPGELVVVVHLSDGADAIAVRATENIALPGRRPVVASKLTAGDASLSYRNYLSWRGLLNAEPPRRPEPARVSSPAASRHEDWKFGFIGSQPEQSEGGTSQVYAPPQRVGFELAEDGSLIVDGMRPVPMADRTATIITFTVDRLVYSLSPPVIFAIVDFDGGGRVPIELTDCTPESVEIGARVEMTFRRLSTADGIANYFWKGRLVPDSRAAGAGSAPAHEETN